MSNISNYEAVFKASQVTARDILRTQMAGRILERIANARNTFITTVKALANLKATHTREEASFAEDAKKRSEKRQQFADALSGIENLSETEAAAVREQVAKQQAEFDQKEQEAADARAKTRAEELKRAEADIEEARKEVARLEDNLAKVNSGEMKVNADELKNLTNELVKKALSEVAIDDIADAGTTQTGS